MSVDRSSAVPLWAQVLDDLRRRMAEGEFAERFPTDQELVAGYGVSRHTAREAARRLQGEGLLQRERGRGSFLRTGVIEQPLGSIYSLYRSLEEHGLSARSVVRELETVTDATAARMLGEDPDAPLVHLSRLRLADDAPMALDESWLPASIATPLLEVDFRHTALYVELAERCRIRATSGWERIVPALPTPAQAILLGVTGDQPLFAIERLATDNGRAVEWRRSVVRGDRYAFVARWSGIEVDTQLMASTSSPGPDATPSSR
jgi:GntR family transcriptional regulator